MGHCDRVATPTGTRIDHVIYGVRDLDLAVDRFRSDYGLAALTTASHPEWGTHNAVVPVGHGQFLELLAVADPESESPLVRGLRRLLRDGERMAGVCLRPPDLDATAQRLSLRIMAGERHERGRVLRFRRTVVESDPQYPFFIDWQGAEQEMDQLYGDAATTNGIAWVDVGGDESDVRAWVGDDDVPIRLATGSRGPQRFALRTLDGEHLIVD